MKNRVNEWWLLTRCHVTERTIQSVYLVCSCDNREPVHPCPTMYDVSNTVISPCVCGRVGVHIYGFKSPARITRTSGHNEAFESDPGWTNHLILARCEEVGFKGIFRVSVRGHGGVFTGTWPVSAIDGDVRGAKCCRWPLSAGAREGTARHPLSAKVGDEIMRARAFVWVSSGTTLRQTNAKY